MNITAEQLATITETLSDDWYEQNCWHTITDNLQARVVVKWDGDTLEDVGGDWYGSLHWDSGIRQQRPAACDGAAIVVWRDRHARLWLQPPTDCTPEERTAIVQRVRDYYNNAWAYVTITVDVRRTADIDGATWTRDGHSSLGAVESDADSDYRCEVTGELLRSALQEVGAKVVDTNTGKD